MHNRSIRNRYFFFLDILLLAPLPALAVGLRLESVTWPSSILRTVIAFTAIALSVRLVVAFYAGLYRCLWPHASLSELQRILYAGAIAGVATCAVGAFGLTAVGFAPVRIPLIALVLDALLTTCVFAAPRLVARFAGRRTTFDSKHRRAIVVGAGAAGQMILREARTNNKLNVNVIAFVDDDPSKQQYLLGGIPVRGTVNDLPALIKRLRADEVIIAIPNARGSVIRRIVQAAADSNIAARTIPALDDLISGRVNVSSLRRVAIEDLLRRESIRTDLDAVRALVTDHAIMVTGAGGSIGSELCRQIADLKPSRLLLLDHSENQMFEIAGELHRRFPTLNVQSVIADVRDGPRLHAIVGRHKPFAIYHAAAHKHVPLMEENVVEAITNNVLGTRNVVDAALDAGTSHLVNISTDKAVRPTSIMGATKRVAEKIVANATTAEQQIFVSVRFGNVLGSRGSVIPTFLRQIAEGGPVTITHPEMRRYFMTIPEAVQLVLQAGALGAGGELFVLDMGESVRIVDLARDLIRLSGLEEGHDIEITFTGVRPGEKLYEEVLFGGEEIRATIHSKVLRVLEPSDEGDVTRNVDELIRSAATEHTPESELRDRIRVLVPEYALEDARTNPRMRPSPVPTVDVIAPSRALLR